MYRIAIVSTHPIQYQTPWYQALSKHTAIDLTVYFCHRASVSDHSDAGFGVEFEWNTPLLEGYDYEFLTNIAQKPSIGNFFGMDTPEVNDIVASEKFDAVIVSGWTYKAAWQTFRACWINHIPVMVRGDSHLNTPRSSIKRKVKFPFYKLFLSNMSACLAVGKWSYEYYVHYGVPSDRIFLVPHIVDENHFVSLNVHDAQLRASLRTEWGLPENAVVFLFCGKLTHTKRPMDFIYAIHRAQAKNPNIMGLVVGDGPLRLHCEEIANKEGVRVKFAGFINQAEMPVMYHISNCIVLTSEGETWGLVVNEAMLSGLPALVSDTTGCWPDLIIPFETGAIYPVRDVEQLAHKMVTFADDRAKLSLMGNQACKHTKQHYGLKQAVDGVMLALERIVKN